MREELRHDYNSGGNLNHIEGQKRGGNPHVYLDTLHYDKFEQRTYMKLGNGVETTYDYKEDNRRLQTLVSHQPNKRRANGRQFQNIHYGYDEVGNITTLANKIAVPANKDMGGPTQQTFVYDKLYRLTSASGSYETARAMNNYTLNMVYDGIHNINQKTQTHDITSKNGGIKVQKGTTYDFGYTYNPSGQNSKQPHAPQKIGNRDFTYDANGNQTGFTSTETSNRRVIQWDEENRIRSIADKGKTSTYTYDDQGQRTTKKNDQGEVAYISQFYVVRNGAIPSKHIYAGTTRILTKRLGGGNPTYSPSPTHPRGNPHDPSQANGNGQGSTDKTNNGKGTNKTQTTTAAASVDSGHPGQGLIHRAERANEVAQNTVKNKHLNGTGLPAPGNPGKGNNGQGAGNGGNSGNTGNGQSTDAGGGGGGNSAWKPEEEFMYYYHPDHLGSTGYVTDEDGLLYEHIEYFPFGETWVQESTVTERTPYLYTSKEFDEDTKLYYYGARYYDPRTSVWQSVDPILGEYLSGGGNTGGVINFRNLALYSYTHLNPVKLVDPDGKDVYLLTWFSKSGETGHAGVAVDNYTKNKAGLWAKNGTFTYYDLWPNNPVDKYSMQTDVPADYSNGVQIDSLNSLKDKDPTAHRTGNVSPEGRAADGIVKFKASYKNTKIGRNSAETEIKGMGKYNACSNNCSTFAQRIVNSVTGNGIDAKQGVKPNFAMKNILGYKATDVVAPNNLYNNALGANGAESIKGPKTVEAKPYLEYFGK